MNNIYLIGFMGTGKSAAAAYLMRQYGLPRVEMDREIEADCGMSVAEIFADQGEEAFRQRETLLLRKITEKEEVVVSCGGGVPLRKVNVDLMHASGTVILLTASPETILKRVEHSNDRPILNGRKNAEGIRQLMEQRQKDYAEAADYVISTDGKRVADVGEEIYRIIKP